jgi:hypothetical protein
MYTNRDIVLQNVRRYRAIASLYRQTAAFRPLQKWSLLDQAEAWEHRAVVELEAYFDASDEATCHLQPQRGGRAEMRSDMVAAA